MKNLDLFTFGVEEINEVQMQEVDGGIFFEVATLCLALCGAAYGAGEAVGMALKNFENR